jgi:SAM-dependent methyltransferase
MKLNLGCGYNKLPGYINVDQDPLCEPDIVADLEDVLPFEDDSVDEIVMSHVLEHLGQSTKSYLNIWKELYRVLRDKGVIKITVPHHTHDNFHHDPTHCRKVTPVGVDMFNQERNLDTIRTGGQETTLGLQVGIDISVTNVGQDFTPWFQRHVVGKSRDEVSLESAKYNNTCYQIHIHAVAHKPPRSQLVNKLN